MYSAQRVWRYRPKPAVMPAQMMTSDPRTMPICDMARGIASTPAPTTASKSAINFDGSGGVSHTGVDQIDDAAGPTCRACMARLFLPSPRFASQNTPRWIHSLDSSPSSSGGAGTGRSAIVVGCLGDGRIRGRHPVRRLHATLRGSQVHEAVVGDGEIRYARVTCRVNVPE